MLIFTYYMINFINRSSTFSINKLLNSAYKNLIDSIFNYYFKFLFHLRYLKFIFPNLKIMDKAFWFQVHRTLMISVPIISITAFIVILADLKWQWVSQTLVVNFVHSIFGIITMALSVVQV
jgi:hypothetical protein